MTAEAHTLPPPPPDRRAIRNATSGVLLMTLIPVILFVPFGYLVELWRTVLPEHAARVAAFSLIGLSAILVGWRVSREATARTWARGVSFAICGYIAVMSVMLLMLTALSARH
jgi:hypothetical protein